MDRFSDDSLSLVLADLLAILNLEQLEVNLFRGYSPKSNRPRVYGGQVIAQALVAASRTVEGRPPHSMHAYFLLGGDPKIPIIYDVERTRDGASFATRHVKAIQHGRPIFSMSVSFHNDEDMLSHQATMPSVPMPEDLPGAAEVRERLSGKLPASARSYYDRPRPIEMRPVDFGRYLGRQDPSGRFDLWIKAVAPLPDDPAIHRCMLAYASDMTLLDTALLPHGRTLFEPEFMAASLDHALWFHRPFRADEWLLYSQDTPNLNGARGLSRGLFFRRDGTLVASVMQEGLIRLKREFLPKK